MTLDVKFDAGAAFDVAFGADCDFRAEMGQVMQVAADDVVQSNYDTSDMTLPSYIKNRLFYYKPQMVIGEIPPNAEDYVVYACIDNLDNKSLTFTVKEKDTSTILETGFTFNARSNTVYRGNHFKINPTSVLENDHYDEFGRSKMMFTNYLDKTLVFTSDEYYAKIPELYLPKAGWNGKKFLPGLMTADKYNPSNANRYSSLLVDNNGHLYNRERVKVLQSFTLKYSDVDGVTFSNEPQILVARSKGKVSQFFKDIDDVESYPVIIIPDNTYTFYFADGQTYKGQPYFTGSSPDDELSSITELTKIGGNYYSAASDWAEIKKLPSTSSGIYDSIGLIAGETYKVTYSQGGGSYEIQLEAAENESLGMVAVADSGGRWTVGDTKTVINSQWVSNGLGSLGSIYKKSVKKVIPIDAIIDPDNKLGSTFTVTITMSGTPDAPSASVDKTNAEIYAAFSKGQRICLIDPSFGFITSDIIACNPSRAFFVVKHYNGQFLVADSVTSVSIINNTVTLTGWADDANKNPLFLPSATAKPGDVWSIKSNGTTGWAELPKDVIISSSTEGSSKKFKISVDDNGTISATEV